MKRASNRPRDELRREYELSKLRGRVRGKHYKETRAGTNLVLLEPDVAEAFPDASSVNEALRLLAAVARPKPRRRGRSTRKRA